MILKPIAARIITLILFFYPILLLTVRGGMNALFFILSGFSIYILINQREAILTKLDNYVLFVGIGLSSGVLAVLLSQIWHWSFIFPSFDSPSRLLFAIPIFIVFRNIDAKTISTLQYGFPLGAISALLIALFMQDYRINPVAVTAGLRASNVFLNPIHFGDLALIMGLLSVFSLNWMGSDSRLVILLKVSGFLSGIIASSLSGTRSGWIAILVVMIAWAIVKRKNWVYSLKRIMVLGACMLAVATVYFCTSEAQQRLHDTYQEIQLTVNGNLDSPIGLRFQISKAALKMFIENPIAGVGADGFAPKIAEYAQSGLVTGKAAFIGGMEVHNHIFGSMARYGLLGLISALLIYLMPLLIFMKAVKQSGSYGRVGAMMGICLVLSFMVFGVTVEMFNLKMIAAFYGLTVAILLAVATSDAQHSDMN